MNKLIRFLASVLISVALYGCASFQIGCKTSQSKIECDGTVELHVSNAS